MSADEKRDLIEGMLPYIQGSDQEKQDIRMRLQHMPIEELRKVNSEWKLTVQTEARDRAYAQLQISRAGLANSDANWSVIDAALPGPKLTFGNFRAWCDQNPELVARQLQWWSEPFAKLKREEEQAARDRAADEQRVQRDRVTFNAAVRAVAAHGFAYGSNEANFLAVKAFLEDAARDFTMENLVQALMRNEIPGLAPNDSAKINEWDSEDRVACLNSIDHLLLRHDDQSQQIRVAILSGTLSVPEIQERIDLADDIADDYSRDPASRNHEFRRVLALAVDPTAGASAVVQMRTKVQQIAETRRLRAMTPEQIRAELADRQKRPTVLYPPLPSSVVTLIKETQKAAPERLPELLPELSKQYGASAIADVLRGE